jgi:hypothetical protein
MRSRLPFRNRSGDLEWLVGRMTLPAELVDGDEVVHPDILLCLELPSFLILGTNASTPKNPVTLAQLLDDTLRQPAEGKPRRPARIRVASEELAAELRGSGIPVTVAPTPELDPVFADLAAHFGGAISYLGNGDIPPKRIAALFTAAQALHAAAPWRHLLDGQIVRVDIPRYGIRGGALSVIGNRGESFGLLLFDTIDDFFAVQNERPPRSATSDRIVLRSLSLTRREELVPSLLREIEQHGWPVAADDAYPVIFSLDAEHEQMPLTDHDVRIMTACTTAFLAFYALHRDMFDEKTPELTRFPSRGDDGAEVLITAPFPLTAVDENRTASASRDVGRNDPCPCGSGKKYKKCCG